MMIKMREQRKRTKRKSISKEIIKRRRTDLRKTPKIESSPKPSGLVSPTTNIT
jgi:hypothetical protein